MACPGSVRLSYGVEDEESDYAALGTVAHALGEACLIGSADAWTYIGAKRINGGGPYGHEVDKPMADAVQVYLNAVRSASNFDLDDSVLAAWVELEFHCPTIHKYFWGKADFVFHDAPARELHVWDYKHGAGIVVEVAQNPQLMYYACGVLEELALWPWIDRVVLHIAQPRGFHFDGPIRSWAISQGDLLEWMIATLVPAMDRALVSRDTASGEHCRFCPTRSRACPQLIKDYDELEKMLMDLNPKDAAPKMTNAQVGRLLDLLDVAKIGGKAAEKTGFARAVAGKCIPGRKLVKARSNREWKEGAKIGLFTKFGNRTYTQRELLSPSKIEALPGGEQMTARYAFKPDRGLTLVRESDTRMVVDKDVGKLFANKNEKGKK